MLFSCERPISEFQSANFIKFFGSGFESKGNDVTELKDGGYILTGYDKIENGSDQQIFVVKVDLNGNLIWSNTYGNSTSSEEGKIVREVSDGFLLAGNSLDNSGITHPFIMKTDVYGNSVWYKEFDNSAFSVYVNDIYIKDSTIYVAGQWNSTNNVKSDFYSAKLKLLPEDSVKLEWPSSPSATYPESGSFFRKVFIKNESILLVGTEATENGSDKISVVTLKGSGNPVSVNSETTPDGFACDVSFDTGQLFVLTNSSSGMQLSKLNKNYDIEWQTELIDTIYAKSLARNEDGTFMVCGESLKEGTSLINFIKVDTLGSTENGKESFRTLQGTVGKLSQTKDKGLILVGTTNPIYGAMVQLIKTDKDLFMLKP